MATVGVKALCGSLLVVQCVVVQAWFHSLSVELTPHNISVTVVCPGPVLSNLSSAAFTGKSGQVRSHTRIFLQVRTDRTDP